MTDWTTFQLFESLWNAISTEHTVRNSPLRTPTVGTFGTEYPHVRTMVLREIHPNQCIFFTDRRSQKCQDISDSPQSSVHCYFPNTKLQLQFYGRMYLLQTHDHLERWKNTALRRPQDYSTVDSPGFQTEKPDRIHYDQTMAERNFAALAFQMTEIHLLTLGTPHRRCKWTLDTGTKHWSKHWVVP